jgi:hypothetical protein
LEHPDLLYTVHIVVSFRSQSQVERGISCT